MRPQLLLTGISIAAMGVLFLALGSLLSISVPLTLTPRAGPVGEVVSPTGSGLPTGSRVFLYWHEKAQGDGTYYYLESALIGRDGRFEGPVTFLVPHAFLGVHDVIASSTGFGPNVSLIAGTDIVGAARFNVTRSGSTGGVSGSGSSELSPLSVWGIFSVVTGLAVAGISLLVRPGSDPIEPPEGHRFCVFCSTPVPIGSARCPHCNGLQPKS